MFYSALRFEKQGLNFIIGFYLCQLRLSTYPKIANDMTLTKKKNSHSTKINKKHI